MKDRGKQIVIFAVQPLIDMLDRHAASHGMSRTQLMNEVVLPTYFREKEPELVAREAERERWGLTA